MQCLRFWPYMIVSYTDRVYEALASHFYIIGLNSLVQDMPSSTLYFLAITCSIQSTVRRLVSFMAQTICVVFPTFWRIALHRAMTPHALRCTQHDVVHSIVNGLPTQYCVLCRLYTMTNQGYGTLLVR